jgi:hypothetical protein
VRLTVGVFMFLLPHARYASLSVKTLWLSTGCCLYPLMRLHKNLKECYCPINNITLSLSLSLSLHPGGLYSCAFTQESERIRWSYQKHNSLSLSFSLPPSLPSSLSLLGVGCNIIWLSVGC